MNHGSLILKKVKSSSLASGKEAKFFNKIYTLHGTGPSWGIHDFSAD
jgi:hypothetical protein